MENFFHAQFLEQAGHQVIVAHGHAAGDQNDVRLERLDQRRLQTSGHVGHDNRRGVYAVGAQHGGQHGAVAVIDAVLAQRPAGRHYFPAGIDQRHRRQRAGLHPAPARRSEGGYMRDGDDGAAAQYQLAFFNILAAPGYIGAFPYYRRKFNQALLLGAVLHHHHRVGPGRHRRAGHHLHAFARLDLALIPLAGLHQAPAAQGGAGLYVGGAGGVTVHGALVERRHFHRRAHVLGQGAAHGFFYGRLHGRQRLCVLQHRVYGFFESYHRFLLIRCAAVALNEA